MPGYISLSWNHNEGSQILCWLGDLSDCRFLRRVFVESILSRTHMQFLLVTSDGHYFVTRPRQPAGWLRKN
jgi:hypothetical protein